MSASRKPTTLGLPVPPPPPSGPGPGGGAAANGSGGGAGANGPGPGGGAGASGVASSGPTAPRGKSLLLDHDAPPTIDEDLPAETTAIDSAMPQRLPVLPEPDGDDDGLGDAEPRWEESTVAEKGSAKRAGPAPAAPPPRRAPPVSGPPSSARVTPHPDDSARVLVDFHEAQKTGVGDGDNPIASMPTAISPNVLIVPTRPLGLGDPAPARLTVIGGNDRGREFVLMGTETSVGRGADNDIILTDIAVSRRHVILTHDGVRYGIRDLSSGNGTIINGVRIAADAFIHDGDQIEIGNTLLRFVHPGAASTMTAPPIGAPMGPASDMFTTQPAAPPPGMPGTVGALATPPGPVAQATAAAPPTTVPLPTGMSLSALPLTALPPGTLPARSHLPGFGLPGLPLAQQPLVPPPPALSDLDPGESAPNSGLYPASPPFTPLQEPWVPPPQGPSPAAMDLFRGQRKLLLGVAAGLAIFAVLGIIAAVTSSAPDRAAGVQSTEAETSPALQALLADNPPRPSPPSAAPPPGPRQGSAATASVSAAPSGTAAPPQPPVVTLLPDATPAGVASPAPVPGPEEKRPPPPAKPGKVDRRPPVKPPVKDKAAAAERQAAALYKDRQFDKAAEVLQAAAASESGATADRLETTARDYVALGAALAKGDAAVAANPTGALVAYQQALTLDARSGRAAHAAYLKGQLAKVAPRAAQAFMSAGKLEQARATCDAADGYGVGTDPAIARTRAQLETKAKDLYGQAQAVAKKSPEQAKALWRRVLKIVPTDSTWYQKSYAALNAGQKGQDEDE